MIFRRLLAIAALAVVIIGMPRTVAAQVRAVAIVVHPSVKVDNLSFAALQKIFRGEQQFWGNDGKSRITLLIRAPVAAERKLVLDRIYGLSEDAFRQFWIAKMFRTESATGPKIVYSSEMARDLVAAIPGAITFLPADAVPAGMKVLRIDGELPDGAKYPLKGR